MVDKWTVTIPELSGDEPRRIYLYLPDDYEERTRRYPVLYMFDGHNVFFDEDATYGKSWGMKEYLDAQAAQLIVVAVECTHDPDNGRLSEYSPYSFVSPNFGAVEGRGAETMEWMVHELKPWVDENLRTMPGREHTMIAGSSMGGLMSLYAVAAYNDVYSRAAALSPSIWVGDGALNALLEEAHFRKNTYIYMDYGSREMDRAGEMARGFARTASILTEKQVYVTSRIVPKGTHCEASWEKQIPIFMPILLYK
ncbi:MAG: alpha/beta hydrolase [Lachnospiraceae bacterium]|nr:alpha/beta hydrolase [Lachnospiraceae bacterium]